MLVEIHPAAGHGDVRGHTVTIDDGEPQWHYGSCDRTTISVFTRHIQAHSDVGGTIVNHDVFPRGKPPVTIEIPACPTGHENVVDDFMGGSVCLDCKAVW